MAVLSYAADAPEVDYVAPDNNYYIGMSYNLFSGNNTHDDGNNWNDFDDTPIYNDHATSFGLNFGKYFGTTAEYRHAIEVGYLNEFTTDYDISTTDAYLSNQYKNIFTLDYLHLRTLTDNVEYFGSLGIGSMELGGSQYNDTRTSKGSKTETFFTLGGGLLTEINDNYDLKLSFKKYTNAETDELELEAVGAAYNDRSFGFEDAYVTSATFLYNF
jgi:hypothetical protein